MTKLPFYGRIPQDEEDELGDYNPLIITKLLKNYRSHPSILEVSPLMSRNACNDENGRFDKILWNRVNFHGFDNFGKFLVKFVKVKSAWKNWRFYQILANIELICFSMALSFPQLPNEMFYDDELESCADKLTRESLCNWSRLPCKGFPIVFEGIRGRDMREEKSPSFFNPEEAAVVVQYVKDLKDTRGIKVLTSEIGVISPYRKQVWIIFS